jgi:hypothetical protein
MIQNTPNPAAGGAAGSGRHLDQRLAEVPGLTPPAPHLQDKSRARLRLVQPARPPRPRHYAVRLSVSAGSDAREPLGRSRAIHLSRDDIDELIAIALRMEEGRRA